MNDQSKDKPSPYSDESQHELIDWNLTSHTPPADTWRIESLREQAKAFSHSIVDVCPAGPDRTLALRNVEAGLMMAVASVARQR